MPEQSSETPKGIVPHEPGLPSTISSKLENLLPGRRKEKRLVELTEQVTQKLLKDVEEQGMVSIFRDKESEEIKTALFSVHLKSPKIPALYVQLRGETVAPDANSIELHKQIFGVAQNKKYISAIESSPSKTKRAIAVLQTWDTPEGSYEIVYRRNADKEASNLPIPRSTGEKIKFLEQILDTTVDEQATAQHFGRPYRPGDTRSSSHEQDDTKHLAFWVRDLDGPLLGLLGGDQPTSLPE
jgi:hypothetical protein